MKKILLFSTCIVSGIAQAQLTQASEPAIGSAVLTYLCDSNAVTYDNVTGSGVTWDYSEIAGIEGQTRIISVYDATATAAADSFPGSVYAVEVENSLTSYYSSTPTERVSQGFLFTEPSFGEVYCMFSGDLETVAQYPMLTNDVFTDNFDGYIHFFYLQDVHEPLTGGVTASVDGDGTLLLPSSTTISNVIRYKLVDTSYTTVPLLNDVELIRTQYEYYDLLTSNLPVFIHTNLVIQPPGGSPLIENTIVLSTVAPTEFVGINESSLEDQISISPNPVNNLLNVKGLDGDAHIDIVDQSGRVLFSNDFSSSNQIDMSAMDAGIYFVKITSAQGSATKTVVKK